MKDGGGEVDADELAVADVLTAVSVVWQDTRTKEASR